MTIEVAASTVSFPSEYRRYRLYLKDNAMRTLATFENAYRLASAMSDQTAGAYVIVATRDPDQPHRIEPAAGQPDAIRSEEHTSELQSIMRISYAVLCLKQ